MNKKETITAIRNACIDAGLDLTSQIAYVLATVEHETGGTFQPVREAFYISEDFDTCEAWRRKHLRYYPYYGRGLVQLTWLDNYRRYSPKLSERFGVPVDLVKNPDEALKSEYAVFILVDGFKVGFFTGKKLTDYIDESGSDFVNARRCINGIDQAEHIAALAEKYQEALDQEA